MVRVLLFGLVVSGSGIIFPDSNLLRILKIIDQNALGKHFSIQPYNRVESGSGLMPRQAYSISFFLVNLQRYVCFLAIPRVHNGHKLYVTGPVPSVHCIL